mmetsp:Transcript_67570/g.187377  ORF Transcript_67570/g.187377 Transcript_67570/m.187377 type:complete len:223 (+) Transcript_67570:263-931(+)
MRSPPHDAQLRVHALEEQGLVLAHLAEVQPAVLGSVLHRVGVPYTVPVDECRADKVVLLDAAPIAHRHWVRDDRVLLRDVSPHVDEDKALREQSVYVPCGDQWLLVQVAAPVSARPAELSDALRTRLRRVVIVHLHSIAVDTLHAVDQLVRGCAQSLSASLCLLAVPNVVVEDDHSAGARGPPHKRTHFGVILAHDPVLALVEVPVGQRRLVRHEHHPMSVQ